MVREGSRNEWADAACSSANSMVFETVAHLLQATRPEGRIVDPAKLVLLDEPTEAGLCVWFLAWWTCLAAVIIEPGSHPALVPLANH